MVDAATHSDAAWWSGDPSKTPAARYRDSDRSSRYVIAKDGTGIAVDVYLPRPVAAGERLPAVMMQTPYFKRMEFRHSLLEKVVSKLTFLGEAEFATTMSSYGYAMVLVDLRGAGSSFGVKKSVMMPDAVRDGADVLDWIVSQPWSNGKVGATGVSAVGMTSQWLTTSKHPALRAIAPRFTVFDIYTGTLPGGLSAARFVREIGGMLRGMDSNRLYLMAENPVARALLRLLIRGLPRADEDHDGTMLARAVAEHAANEHFDEDILAVRHADDRLPNSSIEATLATQSPASFASDMEASGVPVYGWAGWFDGAFVREMINLHDTVRTPGSRIVIGPWGHGGRWNSHPRVKRKRATDFDHVAELVRFFDLHLRDVDHGVAGEAPVHYYVVGSDRWKTSTTWPPPGGAATRLYLSSDRRLDHEPPAVEGADTYVVDATHTTGVNGRYGRHLSGGRGPVRFPDRAARDRRLLTYDSAPLPRALEVTGHPLVNLFVRSTAEDGAFIVYVEDVDPGGEVIHVTDAALQGSWRHQSKGEPPHWIPGPYRTFRREEKAPMVPGEMAELTFDLFPISYVFSAGHRVRVAIAGADRDNLVMVPENVTPTIQVHHGGDHASFIEIPVMAG